MSDAPKFTPYKGPSGVARDSIWLCSEDIPSDRDTIVTIERTDMARNVKFAQGREKPTALALRFVGKERVLLVNATHRRVLNALFSPERQDTGDWWGQKVALYVEQNVRRPDGTHGPAVRIRPKHIVTKPAAAKPVDAPFTDDEVSNDPEATPFD